MTSFNNGFKVGGMLPLTLIDYPGYMATVIFTQGCNLRCRFCYNWSLLPQNSENTYDNETLMSFLRDRQGFIEAVVFSGGEPCMQPHLIDALGKVRDLGYEVGLHTNGFYPEVVKTAIQKRLVQFVAVDYKAPFARYQAITGSNPNEAKFVDLAKFIVNSGVKYEYRTTVHPSLVSNGDVLTMAADLVEWGVENYALQQYKHGSTYDQTLVAANAAWLNLETLAKVRQMLSGVEVRGDSPLALKVKTVGTELNETLKQVA